MGYWRVGGLESWVEEWGDEAGRFPVEMLAGEFDLAHYSAVPFSVP